MQMKSILYPLSLILFSSALFDQSGTIDLAKLSIDNIPLHSTRENMIKQWGPYKFSIIDDSCGFFSREWNEKDFYEYIYPHFTYVGNSKDNNVQLILVDFDTDKIALLYNLDTLNNQTTISDFNQIFGVGDSNTSKSDEGQSILLMSNENDDGARFFFKQGKLVRFEYFSPC